VIHPLLIGEGGFVFNQNKNDKFFFTRRIIVDVFETIRQLPSVKKVSNLPANFPQPLTCLFFLCPALNGSGLKVNRHQTGVTGKYTAKLSGSTQTRLQLVKQFQEELGKNAISFEMVAIYATADPLILFSPPTAPPVVPLLDYRTVTNYQAVFERLDLWHKFYQEEPWKKSLPQRFVDEAKTRIRDLLSYGCPENIRDDFIDRVLAGFALDGVIIKSGEFGKNSVLLGVESPEVAVLQNATLCKEERIPVIQLA